MATPTPQPASNKWTLPLGLRSAQAYAVGGLSGIVATCIIQPIDMVKVRIQLAGEKPGASKSPMVVASQIIKNDGFGALYKGLGSAILRQATYTTTRMGVHGSLTAQRTADLKAKGINSIPFLEKILIGCAAGGIGAVVGTPADVVLIRMQADGSLPVEQRRNYTGVANAFTRMAKEEGMGSYFKGCAPTVVRAMALNAGMFAASEQSKEVLEKMMGKGTATTVLSSSIAGVVAACCSLPFDFVKTRMQKQRPNADGSLTYRSTVHCFTTVLKSEGPLAFYAGLPTYCIRIAPHVFITLLTQDFLNNFIKNNVEFK